MIPQRLGSRYVLREQIGEGGMGVVWRAQDSADDSWRAVKVLRPLYAADTAGVGRFTRARGALLTFRHPNAVPLRDTIVESEGLALVTDLHYGGDLRRLLKERGGKLAPGAAAEIVARLSDALAAAHAAGIVHGDVKPSNVLMNGGEPRLSDFGVARLFGEPRMPRRGKASPSMAYRMSYRAPEALRGAEPTAACDVYSAGAMLYELLTGLPPFTGSAADIVHAHQSTNPRRLQDIPAGLWPLVSSCLSKDPADRPTAAHLSAVLQPGATLVGAMPAVPSLPGPAAAQAGAPRAWRRGWRSQAPPRRLSRRVWWTVAAVAGAAVLAGAGAVSAMTLGSGNTAASARAASAVRSHQPGSASPQGMPSSLRTAVASMPTVKASARPKPTPTPTRTRASAPAATTPAATHPAVTPSPSPTRTVAGDVFKNVSSGLCLDASGGNEAPAVQDQCTGAASQRWQVIAAAAFNGATYDQYQNAGSGLCLSVPGGISGDPAVQLSCTSASNLTQLFRLPATASGQFSLATPTLIGDMCLDISGPAAGANVLQEACTGTSTQTWTLG